MNLGGFCPPTFWCLPTIVLMGTNFLYVVVLKGAEHVPLFSQQGHWLLVVALHFSSTKVRKKQNTFAQECIEFCVVDVTLHHHVSELMIQYSCAKCFWFIKKLNMSIGYSFLIHEFYNSNYKIWCICLHIVWVECTHKWMISEQLNPTSGHPISFFL